MGVGRTPQQQLWRLAPNRPGGRASRRAMAAQRDWSRASHVETQPICQFAHERVIADHRGTGWPETFPVPAGSPGGSPAARPSRNDPTPPSAAIAECARYRPSPHTGRTLSCSATEARDNRRTQHTGIVSRSNKRHHGRGDNMVCRELHGQQGWNVSFQSRRKVLR